VVFNKQNLTIARGSSLTGEGRVGVEAREEGRKEL